MREQRGFLAAFTLAHGGLTLLLRFVARALAENRLATGRPPVETEQWLATLQGVLSSPVVFFLGLSPTTAHWFPGWWGAVPIAVNSMLWSLLFSWMLHRRLHRTTHLSGPEA